MRWILPLFLLCAAVAQTPQPEASALLYSATTAQFANNAIQDVQLKGTVVTHFGKTESGTVTLQADRLGHSKATFDLDSGNRTETSSGHSELPACTWSGPDRKVNPVADHNCWTDGAWFFPLLSLPDALQNPRAALTSAGLEQKNGATTEHLVTGRSVLATAKQSAKSIALLQSLATEHLYLDPKTSLPLSLTFNVHPDNDAGRDIPVEVRFSDYRDVNGVKVPFHIEKSFNGTTVLEITVETVTFNTGAFATAGVAK